MNTNQRVVLFDCDGVLLDSNEIKEDALVGVTQKHFGTPAAQEMQSFHRRHGGVSRQKKFLHIIDQFGPKAPLEQLCLEFEQIVDQKILTCPMASDLIANLETLKCKNFDLYVLSGTPEQHLRWVIERRGLAPYFSRIIGSPKTKIKSIQELIDEGRINRDQPFNFIGDSITDFESSKKFPNCCYYWSLEFYRHAERPTDGVRFVPCLKEALGQILAPFRGA
jgi:phosphoglycolate phosphatase-like HAD superfamily hydrolase